MLKRALLGLLIGIVFLSSSGLLGFFELLVVQDFGSTPVLTEVANAQTTEEECRQRLEAAKEKLETAKKDQEEASNAYRSLVALRSGLVGGGAISSEESAALTRVAETGRVYQEVEDELNKIVSDCAEVSSEVRSEARTAADEAGGRADGFATANDPCATDGAISYIKSIISFAGPICNLLLLVRDGLSSAIGSIISSFNYVFGNMQNVGDEVRSDGDIREFWQFVLSIANYILIAALIAMAFGTSLRLESYTIKKVLPNLLIGFVLANASLFIVGILFDLADLLSSQILRSVNPITAFNGSFNEAVEALKTGGLFGTLEGIARGIFATLATIIMSILWGLGLVVLWLFFWIRYYALQLYAIMAPLAFMSIALPSTRRFFDSWSSGLISWVISKPVAYTVLGFGLAIVSSGVAGIFGWVVGLGAMAYAIILPFQIKGIGSSLAAQLGGTIKGFGISAGKSAAIIGAGRTASSLSSMEGTGRGAALARTLGGAMSSAMQGPERMRLRSADVKKAADLESLKVKVGAAESVNKPGQASKAFETAIGQTADSIKGTVITGSDVSNGIRFLARFGESKDNMQVRGQLYNEMAASIAKDENLRKSLGVEEGAEVGDIVGRLWGDGEFFGNAFQHFSKQGGVGNNATIWNAVKPRLENYGLEQIKNGFIDGAPIFSKSGELLAGDDRRREVVNRLKDRPQQFAQAIIANGGIAKAFRDKEGNITGYGELLPWVKDLAKANALTPAVVKGLEDAGLSVTDSIEKNLNQLVDLGVQNNLINHQNFDVKQMQSGYNRYEKSLHYLNILAAEGPEAAEQAMKNTGKSVDEFIAQLNLDRAKENAEKMRQAQSTPAPASSGAYSSAFGFRGGESSGGPSGPSGGGPSAGPAGGGSPTGGSGGGGSSPSPATKEVVEELRSAAQELRSSAQDISQASTGLGASASEIRQAASDSSFAAGKVSDSAGNLSRSAEEAQQASRSNIESSEKVEQAAKKQTDAAKELKGSAESLRRSTDQPPSPPQPPVRPQE